MERQYVGARYVPVFAEPLEWDNQRSFEALTIVSYLGSSYTSKKAVPSGVLPTNTEYWAQTGNYNAQVEMYRQEVEQVKNYRSFINLRDFGAKGDGSDCTEIFKDWLTEIIRSGNAGFIPDGEYLINENIVIDESIYITGNGKNSKLIFTGNGISIGNVLNSRGTILSNFAVITKGNGFTGITVTGNKHRLDNLYFSGDNIDTGDSGHYWNTCIRMANAWYSVVSNCETMGGPYHTETVSYNRGVGIDGSGSVNCNVDNCIILNHDIGVKTGSSSEAFRVSNSIILNCNIGFESGGYYDTCVNNVMDMMVQHGVLIKSRGVTVSECFIAQHYYAPQKDNPDYTAITAESGANDGKIIGVYTATTTNPNVGFDVNGNGFIIIGCSLSWFKTGILVNGNNNIINSNVIDNAATCDIKINGNYNNIFSNKLSQERLYYTGNGNETQHNELNLYVPIDFTGQPNESFAVSMTDKYFNSVPSTFVFTYPFGGFTCRVDKSQSTATSLMLIFEGISGNLPTASGTMVIKAMV